MHGILSRANAVFAFTLSVLAAMTFACFLTTAFNDHLASAEIGSSSPVVKLLPNYAARNAKQDLGSLNFDVQVDVSPIFNWNVKQLFIYLIAEYITEKNSLNQVFLWDKIIVRGDNPVIDIHTANPKYYFWDDGNSLKGHKNVTLYLSWNVIPNAGTLPLIKSVGEHRLVFPAEYSTSKRL